MDAEKIFSIVIPTYNAEKTIERTLASLISNKDWIYEIIIVNDHCTDNTIAKIEPFKLWLPIKILDNDGLHNASMARKVGILNASGQWIIFVDADDCVIPTSLKYIKECIEENPNALAIYPLRMSLLVGHFIPEQIEFYGFSCVGNVFKLDYLLKNNLLPAEDLPLVEDEYYGKKIQIYISHCDHNPTALVPFAYPMYEIHHDEIEDSLATQNWIEYILHYHLVHQQLLTNDFIKYEDMYKVLKDAYIENFIILFFFYLILIEQDLYPIDEIKSQLIYYKEYLQYGEKTLHITSEDYIKYFNDNPDAVEAIINNASFTLMASLSENTKYSFEDFIQQIDSL